MKNNMRRLIAVLKLFPETAFYSVEANDYGVKLQGKYKASIIKVARMVKFKNESIRKNNGYIEMNRGKIEIVLTD